MDGLQILLVLSFIGLLANAITAFVILNETELFKFKKHYEKMTIIILIYLGVENTMFALHPSLEGSASFIVVARVLMSIMVLVFAISKYRDLSSLESNNETIAKNMTRHIKSSLSEEKEFMNILPYMINIKNDKGEVVDSNLAFRNYVTYREKDASYLDDKHKDIFHRSQELIRKGDSEVILSNGAVFVDHLPIIFKDGREHTFEAVKLPYVFEDGSRGIMTIANDITHQLSKRFSEFTGIDASLGIELDEGFIIIDTKKDKVHINKYWHNWLGRTEQSKTMDASDWKKQFDKRDYIGFDAQLKHFGKTDNTFKAEFRMHDASRASKWVTFKGRVIERNNLGDVTLIAGRINDIDDDKQVELISILNDKIIRTANICFVLTNHEGKIIRTNKAFANLVGLEMSEAKRKSLYEFHYNYEGEGFENIWYDLKINKSISFETVYRNEDYEAIPVEVNATYIENAGMEYASIFITNIDERIQMLEQISKGNERMRLTMEGINEAMLEINFATKEAVINDRGYELLGIQEDDIDLFGQWQTLIHDEDEQRFGKTVESARHHCRMMNVDIRLKVNQSNWRWFKVKGKFFNSDRAGVCQQFFGIASDINDQIELQHSLEEGLKMLQEAEAIAKMGHFSFDLEKNMVTRNENTLALLSIDHRDAEISYEAFIDEIYEDDRKYVDFKLLDAIWNNTHFDIVYRMLDDNGHLRFINARAKAVYDENNRPIITLGTLIDVTEQKERERAIHRSQFILENVVDKSPIGMVVMRLNDLDIIIENEKAEAIFNIDGRMSDEEKWLRFSDIQVYNQYGEMSTFANCCHDFIENDLEREIMEIQVIVDVGRQYLETCFDIIKSTDGTDDLLVISVNDISRLKQISFALHNEKERLLMAESVSHIGHWAVENGALLISQGFRNVIATGDEIDNYENIVQLLSNVVLHTDLETIQTFPKDDAEQVTLHYTIVNKGFKREIVEIRRIINGVLQGVVQDITDSRELIRNLENSRRDMMALINSISEDVVYYDKDMSVVVSNRDIRQVHGMKVCSECSSTQQEGCEHCIVLDAMKDAKTVVRIEELADQKVIKHTASPVFGDNLEIVGAVETRLDITNSLVKMNALPGSNQLNVQRDFVTHLVSHCSTLCEAKNDPNAKAEVMDHTIGRLTLFTGETPYDFKVRKYVEIEGDINNYIESSHKIAIKNNVDHNRIDPIELRVDTHYLKYILDELITNAKRESEHVSITIENRNGYDFERVSVWGNLQRAEYIGIVVENQGEFDSSILSTAVYPFVSGYKGCEGLGLSEVLGIIVAHNGVLMIESKDNLTRVGVYISLDGELTLPMQTKAKQVVNAINMHLPVKQMPEFVEVMRWLSMILSKEDYEAFNTALNHYDYQDALLILRESDNEEISHIIS